MAYKKTLKPGSTAADILDEIEAATVAYMMKRRGIDEKAMRDLLDKDTEVRASYRRKIKRAIEAGKAAGYDPKCFAY